MSEQRYEVHAQNRCRPRSSRVFVVFGAAKLATWALLGGAAYQHGRRRWSAAEATQIVATQAEALGEGWEIRVVPCG